MRISYAWLTDFVGLQEPPQAIADALTACGLEVEAIEEQATVPGGLANVVVGLVLEVARHPGADRLQLCQVDVGYLEPVQIVCGATNVAKGQKVPVALPGAVLHPTGAAEPLTIKAGKIRGELSAGMICAEDELGIGTDHAGIMVLDTPLAPGAPAAKALGLESDFVFDIGLPINTFSIFLSIQL
jgi:phenylalanyl-tRNA synthetase beta chain